MNTSLIPPCQWLPDSSAPENAIREIFYRHWERMKDQFLAAVNQIDTWRQKVIEDTNKYAEDQLRSLATDFDRLQRSCQLQCDENLETTRAYYTAQNGDLFKELYAACQSLEFHMVQLELINGTMTAYKVVTAAEQTERRRKENSTVAESENTLLQEESTAEFANHTQVNHGESSDSAVESLPSHATTTDRPPSTTAFSHLNARAVHNDNNAASSTSDDLLDKCPICFMLFPTYMTSDNRSEHVREHEVDH